MGAGAAKHRAGNDPVFPLLQLTCQQILQLAPSVVLTSRGDVTCGPPSAIIRSQ